MAVARTSDLAPGEGSVVVAGGKLVALFNVAGRYFAIDNTCLHRGGPLGDGDVEGSVLTCPWHGWQYDVETGRHLLDPSIGVRTYPVRVSGDEILVEI